MVETAFGADCERSRQQDSLVSRFLVKTVTSQMALSMFKPTNQRNSIGHGAGRTQRMGIHVHRAYNKQCSNPLAAFRSLLRFSLDKAMTPLCIEVQEAK